MPDIGERGNKILSIKNRWSFAHWIPPRRDYPWASGCGAVNNRLKGGQEMKTLKNLPSAWVLVFTLTFLLSPAISFSEPIKIGAMFISSGKMGGYGKHGR
ncbi:MAG: hypothetical protein WAM61_05385 [Desulfobacterales bacterium]